MVFNHLVALIRILDVDFDSVDSLIDPIKKKLRGGTTDGWFAIH